MRGLFIDCIRTLAHGRQVMSMFSQSDAKCDTVSQRIQEIMEAHFKIKSQ